MTISGRRGDTWGVSAPVPVGAVETLLERLRRIALETTTRGGGAVAFGIDCPLGLPRAFIERHPQPAGSFRDFLAGLALGSHGRARFLDVCGAIEEVDAGRPFYPMRGSRGMRRAAHAAALGLDDASGLFRSCDRATPTRPAGAPIFWTLGANQSGKAAISAWRDLVLPALAAAPGLLRLWPFDGTLAACAVDAEPGLVTLAETYPAEALDQLGLRLLRSGATSGAMRGSKRRQADRAALAPGLLAAFERLGATVDERLRKMAQAGFGDDAAGGDRFDSVAGLLCVLSVLGGQRGDGIPDDPWAQRWEGWVLGQVSGRCPNSGSSGGRSL